LPRAAFDTPAIRTFRFWFRRPRGFRFRTTTT
jgi:hypothetical protein